MLEKSVFLCYHSRKVVTVMKQKRCDISIFGERLRMLRKGKGYSMERFCDAFNKETGQKLSKSTVARWERGDIEPMVSSVNSIARFFGISSMWLIGETDDMHYNNGANPAPSSTPSESELVRIFRKLDLRSQTKLLNFAFELEEKEVN